MAALYFSVAFLSFALPIRSNSSPHRTFPLLSELCAAIPFLVISYLCHRESSRRIAVSLLPVLILAMPSPGKSIPRKSASSHHHATPVRRTAPQVISCLIHSMLFPGFSALIRCIPHHRYPIPVRCTWLLRFSYAPFRSAQPSHFVSLRVLAIPMLPNPSNTIAVGSNSLPSLVISFPSQCISANASLGNSSASQPFAAAGTRRFSSHFFSSMVYTT